MGRMTHAEVLQVENQSVGVIPAPVNFPASGTIWGFPYVLVPNGLPRGWDDVVARQVEMLNEQDARRREQQAVVRADIRRRHENEMRRREMAKVAVVKSTIQLETGEKREGVTASSRVFFVYVTPTGAEMTISKCPCIVKAWSRANGAFDGDSRTVITEYEVKSPTTLKMVNLQSRFGKPKRVVNLMIDVNPEEATIDLQGLDAFGRFKGRGKVCLRDSTYFVNREGFKLTDTVLKEHFGLKVLQPPTKMGAGKTVRSLIFE